MATKTPMQGPGSFQWNAGAWFGGQLGGTAWMLAGAAALAPRAPTVAVAWAAGFVVANAVGAALWSRRDRLMPYPAIQAMLATCGVVGASALAFLHLLHPGLVVDRRPWYGISDDPLAAPGLLLLIAALMAWLHVMERAGRKARSGP